MRYARGDRAWGECARSGRRMFLKDMVRDPLTDLLVDPAWAEPPLPRPPTDIIDGVALEHPAPDLDQIGTTIVLGQIFDISTGEPYRPLVAKFEMSPPTISSTFRYLASDDGTFIVTEDGKYIPLEEFWITEGEQFVVDETGQAIQF